MNYRHAYHAGNFADCAKHALLVALLARLGAKDTPFLVLDTHAGTGGTDLGAAEAARTGEWRDGIARLADDPPPPLLPFLEALGRAGFDGRHYPGSPALALGCMRPDDRLIACELHPEDVRSLRRALDGERRASVHHRDGYEAVAALLPPPAPHRRGLVFLDPSYERDDEWERLAVAIATARRRFPGGVVAAWYPVKRRAAVRAFHDRLVALDVRDLHAFELLRRPASDPAVLSGSGLVVARPPFGFAAEAVSLLSALRDRLADPGDGDAAHAVLTGE